MKYGSVIEEYHALQTHLNFIIDLTGNLAKMSSTMWSWTSFFLFMVDMTTSICSLIKSEVFFFEKVFIFYFFDENIILVHTFLSYNQFNLYIFELQSI